MNKTCIFNKTLTVEMLSILLLTNKAPQLIGQTRQLALIGQTRRLALIGQTRRLALIGQTRRLALKIPNHSLTTLDSTRHFYVQNTITIKFVFTKLQIVIANTSYKQCWCRMAVNNVFIKLQIVIGYKYIKQCRCRMAVEVLRL